MEKQQETVANSRKFSTATRLILNIQKRKAHWKCSQWYDNICYSSREHKESRNGPIEVA